MVCSCKKYVDYYVFLTADMHNNEVSLNTLRDVELLIEVADEHIKRPPRIYIILSKDIFRQAKILPAQIEFWT